VLHFPRLQYFVTERISSSLFSKGRLSRSGAGSKTQLKTEQLSVFCGCVGGRSLCFGCMYTCVMCMCVCKNSCTHMHKLNACCFWTRGVCRVSVCSGLVSCCNKFHTKTLSSLFQKLTEAF